MAKISYSKLKIKQKEEPIIVTFNNNNIEIKKEFTDCRKNEINRKCFKWFYGW